MFDLLHSIEEGADGRPFQTDPTIESTRAVADVLAKINNTKLINYQKIWDPKIGVPDDWLGLEPRVSDGDESRHSVAGYSAQATTFTSNTRVTKASGLSTSANTGTADDPFTLDDNVAPTFTIHVPTTNPGNATILLHQHAGYL
ncbi:hypothetical protein EJ07DRAFT_150717 [Lizonia empirigonia]|nr:hypothetical protein EJ07DRAFT_150717 [Lizonia empirigonia]